VKHAVWLAGTLGFIALAFGMRSAVAVARLIIVLMLVAVALLAFDIVTAGSLSNRVPFHGPICPGPKCHDTRLGH